MCPKMMMSILLGWLIVACQPVALAPDDDATLSEEIPEYYFIEEETSLGVLQTKIFTQACHDDSLFLTPEDHLLRVEVDLFMTLPEGADKVECYTGGYTFFDIDLDYWIVGDVIHSGHRRKVICAVEGNPVQGYQLEYPVSQLPVGELVHLHLEGAIALSRINNPAPFFSTCGVRLKDSGRIVGWNYPAYKIWIQPAQS